MSELKKCSRCRSEIELKYFAINRKGDYNKTCETCLNKTRKTKAVITNINDPVPLKTTDTDFVDGMEEVTTTADSESSKPEEQYSIMVFDVEHSGTGENYVLQLSWGLYDDDGSLLLMNDFYVDPDDYIYINPHVVNKIGLSFEDLLTKPNRLPINELLTKFITDATNCKLLVSHNSTADINTMNKELERNGFDKINAQTYCTMKESKNYCNSKDCRGRLKNPTLNELHKKLFDDDIDSTMAHNSYYDVEICAKCYFKYKSL